MHTLPSIVGYKVDVNKVFKIPPEPLQMYSEKFKKLVDIPIPKSHTPMRPVSCRLLSAKRRQGMVGEKSFGTTSYEPSKYLIIHAHGGGWVAQSSKSRETTILFFLIYSRHFPLLDELYLREWAVKLDIPILSIDYSLTPKAPFPRALEEIFYTYCWILKNVELVGSTAENVVFAGDSAGGNLNTACVVKCIEMGIKVPMGLFNAYTPFLVNFASTPARFLSLVDPLLPFGFIMRIFKSYGAVGLESVNDSQSDNQTQSQINKKKIVVDVFDDNQDEDEITSPESAKSLEAMWHKIKDDDPTKLTNLGSIRETPSEEPSSPFQFLKQDDDENDRGLFMRSLSIPRNEEPAVEPPARGRLGSRTLSEENIVIDVSKDALSVQNIQEKLQTATSSFVNAITNPFKMSSGDKNGNSIPKAAENEFEFTVPMNHYLSPYWAPEEVLKQFPKTTIVTTLVGMFDRNQIKFILNFTIQICLLSCKIDPCVDDCVEFSKKLKKLGVDIELEILHGLNHGFLNFAQVRQIEFGFGNNHHWRIFPTGFQRKPRWFDALYAAYR